MKIKILGVLIDNLSFQRTINKVLDFLDASRKFYIVTPNPEMVIASRNDEEFRKILNQADLAIPDGMGLIWAAKILGLEIKEKIAGIDLMDRLCLISSEKGYRIFLLGGFENVADKTKKCLEKKYPGLTIVGTDDGKASEGDDQRVQKVINKAGSIDFLFIAFGAPKQEKWIKRNLDKLDVKVAMGVGGAFDYLSGNVPRASKWIRCLGLEWLYRLLKEPWRWRRQLALIKFIILVFKERLKR